MNKVEETVLSGNFSKDTSEHFIMAIANVSGNSYNAQTLIKVIKSLYDKAY